MKKGAGINLILAAVIIGMGFLWVRENEMRVSAQSKLEQIQSKAATVLNEKGEVIADLSVQLGEMQAGLQQTTEDFTAAVQDRDERISMITENARIAAAEAEEALVEKTGQISKVQNEMKAEQEKADAALKKKNAELSEMGEELRKTTERLAAALKEKEAAESENYDMKQSVNDADRRMEKLRDDNRRLEALAKICVGSSSASSETADGHVQAQ
jgi:chromosome segregation ATPase